MPFPRKLATAFLALLLYLPNPPAGRAGEVPPWLPHYDLDIRLCLDEHVAVVRERVTWTNPHPCPVHEVMFNVHSHYKIPDKDVGFLAKMVEILRLAPSEAMDFVGNSCEIGKVSLVAHSVPLTQAQARPSADAGPLPIDFHYGQVEKGQFHPDANGTTMLVPLPFPVGQHESVTLDLEFTMRLPPKQGRWGQWKGVTFLAQWLPVVAYYDDQGWQPTPFIPWHQPFFNEAGVYTARVTLPKGQKVGCTASVHQVTDLGNGLVQVEFEPRCARDFALFCSDRYQEFTGQAGPVRVRVLAFPEHAFYAQELVRIACEAIPEYSKWFGPFPYPEFTLVETYFGWNGNECGGLVMIDERIFGMPHLACNFVDYLVSHEICHQWWYNAVGTNGYCETWMDEGLATYFSHRLITHKCGVKNSTMLEYP